MLGAIIGDIAGSRFEWHNIKTKDFELFAPDCRVTDDTVMSLAVCAALLRCGPDCCSLYEQTAACMREFGRRYPHAGYGGRFKGWLRAEDPHPYQSFGNGAAMRVSGCGFAASSLAEAKLFSRIVTDVTHDHPEGIRGAEAAAAAVWMARNGSSMAEIRQRMEESYYRLDFTLDEIRPTYHFDVTCQGSVPQALEAFFESQSFEDAIRNAVSIGGDSDTIAAITGAVAEAYYGIPSDLRARALTYLSPDLLATLTAFEDRYGTVEEK